MESRQIFTAHKTRKWISKGVVFCTILLIAVLAFLVLRLYTDYLEVKEIGSQFVPVFWKQFWFKIAFSALYFLIAFVAVYLTTQKVKKNLTNAGIEHAIFQKKWIVPALCAVVAFFAAQYMGESMYEKFLFFSNATSFGIKDPVMGLDLSYYVFKRPFLEMLVRGLFGLIAVTSVYSILMYCISYLKIGERDFADLVREKSIMLHVIAELLFLLVILAASVWLDAQKVLTGSFMNLVGGGFVDINIWLKFYHFAPFIIIVLAVVCVIFLIRKKYLQAVISCVSYLAILAVIGIVAWLVQLVYVSPNEVSAEAPYIGHNIEMTRYAYNLDNVSEHEYAVAETIDDAQNISNHNTVQNIRIIDFPATITATNQVQTIRGYYKFNDMNVGLYQINGEKEAVAVGAREIAKEQINGNTKNYINEKFRYTHGYGVVMAEMDSVTKEGEPNYLIKNLTQTKKEGVPFVTQPRIYFGQLTNDEVIVNTKIKELDYSEGTKDIEFNYDGDAGIGLNYFNRILFAFRTGDFRMLIANQITDKSRLLLNRNIMDRVKTVAPFFKYDTDPTIIIDDDGTLKWVIDAYTTANTIPYAQKTEDYNYIRNSIKVVVDAYTGDVTFYIIDKNDPIVKTYAKIYPSLFSTKDLPKSIQSKTKYPEYLFKTQCQIYTQYHVTDPGVFYNRNDVYAIANEKYKKDIQPIEPYYNIMYLKEFNENDEEMILMMPFTLQNKENMVSWIAAGNEGDNYGKLISYKFPKDYTVYGPLQIENMIDNDPEISKEMSLWNAESGGSSVIRGNLLVIPVGQTILYVEPVYITTENQAALPQLQRMIVGCNGTVVMGESMEDALLKLFGESAMSQEPNTPADTPSAPVVETTPQQNEIKAVTDAYAKVEQAASVGDWAAFGAAMNELEKAVTNLQK